jgi:hypothetical protein
VILDVLAAASRGQNARPKTFHPSVAAGSFVDIAAVDESYRLKNVAFGTWLGFLASIGTSFFLRTCVDLHCSGFFRVFVMPNAKSRHGKADILSDLEQTYTLLINKTLWITDGTTVLFAVCGFFITRSTAGPPHELSAVQGGCPC